ncbi:MAG: tetratricopeptide repeat protein [Jatrophihabitantaceae bacterium]
MSGAVDLAAVKARSEAAARAAEAPAPTASQSVVDATEASFQTDVLDRSFQVPVLVALWSARSPASEQLANSLQALALENAGAFVLAKVDVDTNMAIAQALQVKGVPAVLAVLSGQLIPGFEGGLPEAQLREFIAAVLQAGSDAGLAGAAPTGDEAVAGEVPEPPEAPEDPRFDAAEVALADGDYALAEQRFQAILDAEPANSDAAIGAAQVRLLARIADVDPSASVRADAAPDDIETQLLAADLALAGDDADAAFQRLLEVLGRTDGETRDEVRERLLDYFVLLGPDDPRVPVARRAMARALF